MFHLYRIYGLEEVIHENLRPEKLLKLFVRGPGSRAGAKGIDEDDGNDAAEAVDATHKRRTRAKAKAKDTDDGEPGEHTLRVTVPGEASTEGVGKAVQTPPQSKRRRTQSMGARRSADVRKERPRHPVPRHLAQDDIGQPSNSTGSCSCV